jgi:hypothetical protein
MLMSWSLILCSIFLTMISPFSALCILAFLIFSYLSASSLALSSLSFYIFIQSILVTSFSSTTLTSFDSSMTSFYLGPFISSSKLSIRSSSCESSFSLLISTCFVGIDQSGSSWSVLQFKDPHRSSSLDQTLILLSFPAVIIPLQSSNYSFDKLVITS